MLRGRRGVGFEVASYDHSKPLIIDPVLSYSTYLGGGSSDYGYGIAVDSSGNAYVTGWTYSTDFPLMNPYQSTNTSGYSDGFVTKLNFNSSNQTLSLVYSTFLGGSSGAASNALAIDASGNAYVTGTTSSTDFPTMNPVQAENDGGGDAFVTELNATGSALVYSTYLGGSAYDYGIGMAVDAFGNSYVTGQTESIDFPTSVGAFQTTDKNTVETTFVAKLNFNASSNPPLTLVYSTYLGGSTEEEAAGVAADSSGDAYMTGYTYSSDFPLANAYQSTCLGCPDNDDSVYVTELNPTGSALVYSTFLGGSNTNYGYGIAIDASGNTYVTGNTFSTDFPVVNPFQSTNNGNGDAFVAKFNFNASGDPPLTLVYSTYLGGSNNDVGNGIAADSSGNAYVTGVTYSSNFPTSSPFQATCGSCSEEGSNAFVAKFNAAGSTLVYSSYLGGNVYDSGNAIAVDSLSNAYVTGYTDSTTFPTVNAFQATNHGLYDVFVSMISPSPSASVMPSSLTFTNQNVGTTSAAQTVTLSNMGDAALSISGIATTSEFEQTNVCGSSLAAGANCSIMVTFTPNAIGTQNGSLTVTDNANFINGNTQTVSLTGTGVASVVMLSPANLNFTDLLVGTTSSVETVTLTNSGSSSLIIASIVLNGADFALVNNTCPASLAMAASCTFGVTFTPTANGVQTGTVVITDNAMPGMQSVGLYGTGRGTENPVPFLSQPLSPTAALPGGGGFTLTVNGSSFLSSSVVQWNGIALATTYVSEGQLTATVPPADIAAAGTASVTVVNPTPGGGTSNVEYFTITSPTSSVATVRTDIAVQQYPVSVVTGDFNGDGIPDLAVVNDCGSSSACGDAPIGSVSILLGNGDGTFTLKTTLATSYYPEGAAVGDFNGDGKLDLAVVNECSEITCYQSGTVSVFVGNGDGTFTLGSLPDTGFYPYGIAVGDFNGDGKLDLAVVNECGNTYSCSSGSVSILVGNGDGTFTLAASPTVGRDVELLAVGDFNHDGILDIVVPSSDDGSISILLGNGDGTFAPSSQSPLSVGECPFAVATGDLNGDGNLDLAVTDTCQNNVNILLGNGNGTFSTGTPVPTGKRPHLHCPRRFKRRWHSRYGGGELRKQ